MTPTRIGALLLVFASLAACGDSDDDGGPAASEATPDATTAPPADDTVDTAGTEPPATEPATTEPAEPATTEPSEPEPEPESTEVAGTDAPVPSGEPVALRADVWADNWFQLWVNGELVGEDSVPITTERSFNAETFTFEATLPVTVALEARDFKEDDTGLEYIGTDRQQMGDGGVIFQILDADTGDLVVATDDTWRVLVTHVAPLDKACERSADPTADCGFVAGEAPEGWTDVGFDDGEWDLATIWTEGDVGPKDGYDEIDWDPAATLVWAGDLETDNTVLLRTVSG